MQVQRPPPSPTNSGQPSSRKIVALLLLAALPFVMASPLFANEAGAQWGTYIGDAPNLFVRALAPTADGVVMTLGFFGAAGTGREALAFFDSAGTLRWRSFYGGILGSGTVTALSSVPALDLIYMVGHTTYDDGIATPGAHQGEYQGARGAIRHAASLGLFAEGVVAESSQYPDTASFRRLALDENPGARRRAGLHHGLLGFGNHGFVAQFDATGELRWGTYFHHLPDSINDYVHDADAEADGGLYICGETETVARQARGFLARFDVDGMLQWTTALEGACTSLAADPARTGVVIAGWATPDGDFATRGAHQREPVGANNFYLARFDARGDRQWSTYFGRGRAFIHDLAVDDTGAIYVVGATDSSDLPITRGAHQNRYGGGESDLYFVKFTAGGRQQWATYFGGESYEHEARAALDGAGNLYFSATTGSKDLATTGRPTSPIGQSDVIFGKFRRDGSLAWARYFGGELGELAGALAIGPNNRLYLGGQTQSTSGIATPDAHQTELRDYQSGFLAMFRAR